MKPILDFNDNGGAIIEIPQVNNDYSLVVNHWKNTDIQVQEIEQDILQSDTLQRSNFLKKYAEELQQKKEQFQKQEKECEDVDKSEEEKQFFEEVNMEYDKSQNCLSVYHSELKHSMAWYLMNCVDIEIGKIENEIEKQKGILIANNDFDTTIKIIRGSISPDQALIELMKHFSFSKQQAKGVINLTIREFNSAKIKDKIILLENQKAFLEKLRA